MRLAGREVAERPAPIVSPHDAGRITWEKLRCGGRVPGLQDLIQVLGPVLVLVSQLRALGHAAPP